MTNAEFARVFAVLALQLRAPNDADTIDAYFEALNDLALLNVFEAAKFFSRESGRRFFPTSAEWRERAAMSREQELRNTLPKHRAEPWRYECDICDDSGWAPFDCPDVRCGRRYEHTPHHYVLACACRPTNHSYQRKQSHEIKAS